VGHRAVELQGARDVGMKTIAFNYDADAEADFYIEDFSQLLTSLLNAEDKASRAEP
jgi:hypothetical protein